MTRCNLQLLPYDNLRRSFSNKADLLLVYCHFNALSTKNIPFIFIVCDILNPKPTANIETKG